MDDADLEELRLLRERAYGPDADIAEDPAAARRLTALEKEARDAAAPAAAPERRPETTTARGPDRQPEPPADRDRQPEPSADRESDGPRATTAARAPMPHEGAPLGSEPRHPAAAPPMPTPRLDEPLVRAADGPAAASALARPARAARRRWFLSPGLAVLWIISLVAVAAVATGMTLATTWATRVTRTSDAPQIATLAADPAFAWPEPFPEKIDGVGYTFHGLSIIAGADGLFGTGAPPDSHCLFAYVADTARMNGFSGPVYSGCSAGSFPAAIQLTVTSTMPSDLVEAVGRGTALQFVLDGDRIGVFADDSGAGTEASPTTS